MDQGDIQYLDQIHQGILSKVGDSLALDKEAHNQSQMGLECIDHLVDNRYPILLQNRIFHLFDSQQDKTLQEVDKVLL